MIVKQVSSLTLLINECEVKIKNVEAVRVRQPNSALYYFDQEKRQDILKNNAVQTAEQAYNLIKSSFESLQLLAQNEYKRYESMSAADAERYQLDLKEQRNEAEKHRTEMNSHIEKQADLEKQLSDLRQKLSAEEESPNRPHANQEYSIYGHPVTTQLQAVIHNQQTLLV